MGTIGTITGTGTVIDISDADSSSSGSVEAVFVDSAATAFSSAANELFPFAACDGAAVGSDDGATLDAPGTVSISMVCVVTRYRARDTLAR
jgi:hypothetical protein